MRRTDTLRCGVDAHFSTSLSRRQATRRAAEISNVERSPHDA
jgi:hypothetical protein